jgi:hypothetical protein
MRPYHFRQVLVVSILLHIGIVTADENKIQQQKLDTINKLINESSVSENILSSENEVAIQYYNLSTTAYKHAVAEFEKGDIETSNLFIKKATDALTDATMLANINKKNTNLDSDRHRYNDTKKSVDALLEAVHRVAEEKGVGEENREMISKVNKYYEQARINASNNLYVKANQNLEQILTLIRKNIIGLKMGDTLVRTLTFSNPKEEFRYEIDRNDAHFLLLKTFLPKQAEGAVNSRYAKDTKTAYKLRKEAESHAKNRDYKHAISMLEESTEILINVIRMAGAHIPG